MTSAASVLQSHCPDEKLVMLAEMAGINCIHLTSVSRDDAITALTGLALYHHLDPQSRREVLEHRKELPGPFRAALDRAAMTVGNEAVHWEHGAGSTQTVIGNTVDYDAIGIRPSRIDVFGYYLHYAVVDGTFIVFRDNPRLWYFTQNTRQGTFNYWSSLFAKNAAKAYSSYVSSKFVLQMPGIKHAAEHIRQRTGGEALYPAFGGVLSLQEHIPVWNQIVGTPIPQTGTVIVLVYLSEDGRSWPRRARMEVSPDGTIRTRTWETNS